MPQHLYAPLGVFKDHPASNWLNARRPRPKEASAIIERMKRQLNGNTAAMGDPQIAGAWVAANWISGGAHSPHENHLIAVCEGQLLQSAAAFDDAGRPIFCFGANLSEELLNTDLEDARVRDLNPPDKCFYIAYEGVDLKTPDGELIDGFMIQKAVDSNEVGKGVLQRDEEVIEILIFTRRDRWSGRSSIPHVIIVPGGDKDEPIMDAINRYIDWEVDSIRRRSNHPESSLTDSQFAQHIEYCVTRANHIRSLAAGIHRLLAGSLLYLTSYHDQSEVCWPKSAPEKLVKRAMAGGDNAAKAEKELTAKGWVKLKYFDVRRQGGGAGSGTGENNTVTHWRRGHWRRQAHGKGLSERRMRWIRPHIMNARPEQSVPVREYMVDQPASGTVTPVEQQPN